MTLRGTRQYVEILQPGSGKARATRQYIEFIEPVSAPQEYEVDATDTVDLTEQVNRQHFVYCTCSDTIDFDEHVFANRYYVSCSDTISLNESAARQFIGSVESFDALSLTEVAKRASVTYIEAYDFFQPYDEAIRLLPAEDMLLLADSADRQIITNLFVVDTCDLDESANRQLKAYRAPATPFTYLTLSDSASCGKVLGRSSVDSFDLVDDADAIKVRPASDTLSLTDLAEGVKTQHGVDSLTLSELADANHVYARECFDHLRLRDVGKGGFEYECIVSDTLDLNDAALIQHDAIDTLALSDTATAEASRPAVDSLELSDTAHVYNAIHRTGDVLDLADTAASGKIYYRAAIDAIGSDLSELANQTGPRYPSATDVLQTSYIEYGPGPDYEETVVYLGLSELAEATVTKHRQVIPEDELTLEEVAAAFILNESHSAIAIDVLVLTDSTSRTPDGGETELLDLSDSAEASLSRPIQDTLELSDSATRNVVFNLAASDAIDFSEAILAPGGSLEDYVHVYHPFVGTGPESNPTPPPTELEGPIVGITVPFQLVYPVTGPFDDTLSLRAPNLGNRDRFQGNRINRETRGGTLIVYADQMWPKIKTLVLQFSGLTSAEAQALHTFIDSHLGQEIGLMDWEHRFWSGVITTFDDPITQDGRGCKFSVGFEFEGELTTYSP